MELKPHNNYFDGECEILTCDGYKKINELVNNQFVYLLDEDNNTIKSEIWFCGFNPVVELGIKYKTDKIICSPNTQFKLSNNTSCEASDLLSKALKTINNEEGFEVLSINRIGKKITFAFQNLETETGIISNFIINNKQFV
jgi:hypothetical protein